MASHLLYLEEPRRALGGYLGVDAYFTVEQSEDCLSVFIFQWQNETRVPMYPKIITKRAKKHALLK